MKTLLIAALLALTVAVAGAEERPAATAPKVTVYLQGQHHADLALLSRARTLASGMFAQIGVRLEWKAGRPPRNCDVNSPGSRVVAVRLAVEADPDSPQAVPAYALPYAPSGTQAVVFYDRAVPPGRDLGSGATFLAHLLAHEIGHVLQGIGRHSDAGVMKAHWNREDQANMRNGLLPFTPYDAELIRTSLATNEK